MKNIKKKKVLRVAVLNNFNHTDQEIEQLNKYENKYNVFVNSNAMVPIKYGPCIVTINPGLDSFVEPTGDISKIAAARIKVVAGPKPGPAKAMMDSYLWAISKNIPVLLTAMRFRRKDILDKFVANGKKHLYMFTHGYYRIKDWGSVKEPYNSHYCDKSGLGCQDCGNCAFLTYGDKSFEIRGLNLSSSGVCSFNCPDCFAKCILMGRAPVFDKVFVNKKMNKKSRMMRDGNG